MRNAYFAILAAGLAISGCGDNGQSQTQQPARPIKVRGEAQRQLHEANDLNRAIALKRAIYDSGYACKRVTKTGFVGDYKNMDIWMTQCADGRDWAVFIGPDGSAQVRDCKDVAAVGLPACVIKSEEASAEPVTAATGNSTGESD